jgi:hypothetical protein
VSNASSFQLLDSGARIAVIIVQARDGCGHSLNSCEFVWVMTTIG